VTKPLNKVKYLRSTDFESINSQGSNKIHGQIYSQQAKSKAKPYWELDSAITEKIWTEDELEEEISNADYYQFTLNDRIPYLTEFTRKLNKS